MARRWPRDVTDYGALLRARCVCPRVEPLSRVPRRLLDSTIVKPHFRGGVPFASVRLGLVVIALGPLVAAAPASAATVVSGTVLLDPAQPVCRVGDPCTKPLAHFKLVF